MPMPPTLVGPSWSTAGATDGHRADGGTDRSHPVGRSVRPERMRWSEAHRRQTAGEAGGEAATRDR